MFSILFLLDPPFKESSLIFISYYLTHFSLCHSFLHIYFDAFLCKTLLLMKILAIIHVNHTLFQQIVEYIIFSWWSFNVLSIDQLTKDIDKGYMFSLSIAIGSIEWSYRMVLSNGLIEWSYRMALSNCLIKWSYRMGPIKWSYRMALSNGSIEWSYHMVLSNWFSFNYSILIMSLISAYLPLKVLHYQGLLKRILSNPG